jgi:hypothetical protein
MSPFQGLIIYLSLDLTQGCVGYYMPLLRSFSDSFLVLLMRSTNNYGTLSPSSLSTLALFLSGSFAYISVNAALVQPKPITL